jgi:hypothetical protein
MAEETRRHARAGWMADSCVSTGARITPNPSNHSGTELQQKDPMVVFICRADSVAKRLKANHIGVVG